MLPRNHPDRIQIAFDDPRLVANAGLLLPVTLAQHLGLREVVDSHVDLGVGNQQKWHTLKPERSWVGWRSGELPEGPVVASSPFDCLSLHLPSPAQYVFTPAPQHVGGRHVAQGLVITPVVVVADEGHDGRLEV